MPQILLGLCAAATALFLTRCNAHCNEHTATHAATREQMPQISLGLRAAATAHATAHEAHQKRQRRHLPHAGA